MSASISCYSELLPALAQADVHQFITYRQLRMFSHQIPQGTFNALIRRTSQAHMYPGLDSLSLFSLNLACTSSPPPHPSTPPHPSPSWLLPHKLLQTSRLPTSSVYSRPRTSSSYWTACSISRRQMRSHALAFSSLTGGH